MMENVWNLDQHLEDSILSLFIYVFFDFSNF